MISLVAFLSNRRTGLGNPVVDAKENAESNEVSKKGIYLSASLIA
jgi:hypothetical protein